MTTEVARAYSITLADISIAWVSFALLLGTALLVPEQSMDLGFYRTVYTIWVTTALVTPALCAFALPGESQRKQSIWVLFWTFAFIAYLVHVAYASLSVYHGSFQEFLQGQGLFAAVNNFIFTAWWALDVFLAWFYHHDSRWVQIERVAGHIFIGLTFFVSTVFLKHGFINVLGALLTVSVLICLMFRFDARRREAAA